MASVIFSQARILRNFSQFDETTKLNPRLPAGVLLSGGLDSSILLGHLVRLGCQVQPFYVRKGLTWEPLELMALRRYLAALAAPQLLPLVVLELPITDVYGTHWSVSGLGVPDGSCPDRAVFLPGRNALLVIKAALWCQLHGIRQLALGVLGSSPFADAGSEFFAALQAALNCEAVAPIQLVRPLGGMSKRQVMELGRGLPLEWTFSCIAPAAGLHCGRCNKCTERQAAFASLGLDDPTPYAAPPGRMVPAAAQ